MKEEEEAGNRKRGSRVPSWKLDPSEGLYPATDLHACVRACVRLNVSWDRVSWVYVLGTRFLRSCMFLGVCFLILYIHAVINRYSGMLQWAGISVHI